MKLADTIREKRKSAGLTQIRLAKKAGVGLRLIRDLEQGTKRSFRTDAVNKILRLFGKCLGPVDLPRASDDKK
ncbi:MAG: helix-turn-helix domain-containing protein [Elusimicrobia bacterium]|nr:helix-turn-helix domain-containing protein [Candidatus Obscuribacterium magneticum]MCB4755467.1 helix-turn-helix domain-containing protein [Candidatus Obscuribacterium magneticum]